MNLKHYLNLICSNLESGSPLLWAFYYKSLVATTEWYGNQSCVLDTESGKGERWEWGKERGARSREILYWIIISFLIMKMFHVKQLNLRNLLERQRESLNDINPWESPRVKKDRGRYLEHSQNLTAFLKYEEFIYSI